MLVHLRSSCLERFGASDAGWSHTFTSYHHISERDQGRSRRLEGGGSEPGLTSKKRVPALQEIMSTLGKLETFIRNTKMNGKTTSRFELDYFPRNLAWKAKSWKGCWRMWRF
jgi:hypothetical protein